MNQIKLDNGWLIDIEMIGEGYKITRIVAQFRHGVYHLIDTKNFDDEIWHIYHEAIRISGYK